MRAFNIKGHEVLVDDEDAHWLENLSWYLIKARQLTEKYYVGTRGPNNETVYLHRVITEAARGEVVDHINGNPLDNRRENLRITTSIINRLNCTVRANKQSSKYKGVFKNKRSKAKPFYSMIRQGDKKIWYATFASEMEAAEAYNKKLIELFPDLNKTV